MKFRESVAYSKDLITGRKLEVVKNKPIAVPTKGVFTVELFDAITGEKTYEAKSENRISAVFANAAYLDGYFYKILDNTVNNDIYRCYNSQGYGPCNVLALTDGDIPEDPYDYWMWGNVIGYCDLWQNYAGSNTRRGNRNANESTRPATYANGSGTILNSVTRHWVVDFPTSAGNGTFKSIYLTGYGSMESGGYGYPQYNWLYDKKWLKSGNSSASLGTHCVATDETYFYALKVDSTKVYCWDKRTWVAQTDKALPANARSICYDKYTQSFWILHTDGTFKNLDKNFQVLQTYGRSAAMDTVDGVTMTTSRYYWDICVTESNVLYTFYTYNSNQTICKTVMAVYNKDGTFVKNITIHSSSGYNATVFEIPNNKLMVVANGIHIVFNKTDLSIYSNSHSGNNAGQWSSGSDFCRWDFDLNLVCRYWTSSYGYIGFSWVVPAGAHTLLPEPVTKTPTNTMKIQYDLTVDYVYPLDMPPH